MSKILRRPMFRGGPVDSRGTGITSGLMDKPSYATGGRVGFSNGGSFFDIFKGADTRGYNNLTKGGDLYPQTNTFDLNNVRDTLSINRNILDQKRPVKIGEDTVYKTTEEIMEEKENIPYMIDGEIKYGTKEKKAKDLGYSDVSTMEAIERENKSLEGKKDIKKILNYIYKKKPLVKSIDVYAE